MKECEIIGCNQPAEQHHIVYRSKVKGLDVDWNYSYLCDAHHRTGKNCPHLNKSVDIEYKSWVQQYLTDTLYKDYYTINQLMEVLKLSHAVVKRLVKTLQIHKSGFDKKEVIFKIMGDRNYL